jgi:hypothetical protein
MRFRLILLLSCFALFSGCMNTTLSPAEAVVECDDFGCYICDDLWCEPLWCVTSNDCPTGFGCDQYGSCLPDDFFVGGDLTTFCTAHDQCPDDQICSAAGVCTNLDAFDKSECESDAMCPDGEICAEGRCTSPPLSSDMPLRPETLCQVNDDCPNNGFCFDASCHLGCETTTDCPVTQSCKSGLCLPSNEPAGECNVGSDCTTPSVCKNSTCISICLGDADCGTGLRCAEALCLPDNRPRLECLNNSGCASGFECLDGRCVSACGPEGACIDGQRCVFGFCVLDTQCVFNKDCADEDVCINGSCTLL